MDNLGLFTECTRYNDDAASENRLTQVFAAAFNYSAIVRKAFFKLVGCKKPCKTAFVATQLQEKGTSRPDMFVYLEENLRKFIVVESKTDLKQISKSQLKKHQSFAKKKGIAEKLVLISRYQYNIPNGWTSVLWYDLAQNLTKLNLDKSEKSDFIDGFVCKNFVDFLKEYGYMKSTCITVENFENASKCINNIRMKQSPSTSVNKLLDVQRISDFLSFCMEYVNLNSDKISEKVKRKTNAPVFGYWYENGDRKGSKITLGVKQKINSLRNGVTHIGFMFRQLDDCFSLCFNLWKEKKFITLAEWSEEINHKKKSKNEEKNFKVWKFSTNKKTRLNTQLLVCDVAELAIKEWNLNYSSAAGDLGFDGYGT